MSRYHFRVCAEGLSAERSGVDLAGLPEARTAAILWLSERLRDHPDDFWMCYEWHLDVTDEHDLILFSIILSAHDSAAISS